MSTNIDFLLNAYNVGEIEIVPSEFFCKTRDVFRARHDRWFNQLQSEVGVETAGLILTIIGEVGNNSFDHNLGHWTAALTQRITGRAPERRGNGLKVSLEAVRILDVGFCIRSGKSSFSNQKMIHPYSEKLSSLSNKGVLMMLDFRKFYEN